jgi:pSer/pThr/pTyr-binding forkhead associated (FHA) protein
MVVVGRHRHCDSRLISPRVSRWHCCLTEVEGQVWVRDLGSTNGVWINGQRTTSGRLQPGDVLSIAHICYQVADGAVGPGDRDRPTTEFQASSGQGPFGCTTGCESRLSGS